MITQEATQQLDAFFGQYQAFSFKAGDVLLHSGDAPDTVFYLKSGIIKQSSTSATGQENTITLFKSGAFFPLIWVIQESAIPYDFIAVTNGHGWKAPRLAVLHFLQHNATVTFDLTTRLLSGLEGLSRKVGYAFQATAKIRIAETLLTLAYRFGKPTNQQLRLTIPLTHQDLADMTGLTRETVTRELKTLRQNNLIVVDDKGFLIPDILALEQAAGISSQGGQ